MSETSRELMKFARDPLVIASIARLQRDDIKCMDDIRELAKEGSEEIDRLQRRLDELDRENTFLRNQTMK